MSRNPGPHSIPAQQRIAKAISRAGITSRRKAEALIASGKVSVNGIIINDPAIKVGPVDIVEIEGTRLPDPARTQLWRHHKPRGCVTTHDDERGRHTVFKNLPPDIGHVHTIGRLDMNSEGLLLLTNDGELKRRLELPQTGWQRVYRVRAFGTLSDASLRRLQAGIDIHGLSLRPMEVTVDRNSGRNCWLTIRIREGKNREIRRALATCNLTVNRLIRVSYGPFRLGDLPRAHTSRVADRTLRRQIADLSARSQPSQR
ncbi:MAG: pseudouridine synthase [Rhodobacteraceae bacterium]|nr:pseudouridine synthase [Paracoccaceae bacterium]